MVKVCDTFMAGYWLEKFSESFLFGTIVITLHKLIIQVLTLNVTKFFNYIDASWRQKVMKKAIEAINNKEDLLKFE